MLRMLFTFVTHAKGVSAVHMSRERGVSHKTAYVLMQKLREALMVSVDDTKLAGLVHVDGAHAGGKARKANKKADRQKRQQRDKILEVVTQLNPNRRIVTVGRWSRASVASARSWPRCAARRPRTSCRSFADTSRRAPSSTPTRAPRTRSSGCSSTTGRSTIRRNFRRTTAWVE